MSRAAYLMPLALLAVIGAAVGMTPDPKDSADVIFAPTGSDRLIEKRIARELGAAKKKIVVAMYQFTSRDIAQALAAARKRGVDVRVLMDAVQVGKMEGPWAEAMNTVEEAKIPIRKVSVDGSRKNLSESMRPKFHHKFCVIDGERVLTGSYNWTVLADEENHENLVILSGASIAAKFADQFEKIWKDDKLSDN